MSPASRFRHQTYQSGRPISPFHLLPAISPTDPQSVEFSEQLQAAGAVFNHANVVAIYCVHGTFAGTDLLGLVTELSRFAPNLGESLGRCGKRIVDAVTGEAGNYTPEFAATMESEIANGADRLIPVRLFHWSGQNNHIARADGAIRLLHELAQRAEQLQIDSQEPPRILLWGHSHGGNVFALASQLLGADQNTRETFFKAAKYFYQPWFRQRIDLPAWLQVKKLLGEDDHPLRRLQLDIVTYGTPLRYGWDSAGYAKLLHFIHHRPPQQGEEYQAPVPLKLVRACQATDGDYVQQIGIAGTNFMPCPLALRTLIADRRLSKLLEESVTSEGVFSRLRHGARVPDDGETLLVDYNELAWGVHRHLAGHGLYTRRKWLPFHCREIVKRFYGTK